MEHEMDDPAFVKSAKLVCGHSQKLDVVGQEMTGGGQEEGEGPCKHQTEPCEDKQGPAVSD
jgi:hypothetical protein